MLAIPDPATVPVRRQARRLDAVPTRLVAAVLASVEHDEVCKRAKRKAPIHLRIQAPGFACPRHRQPFVVGLIGGGPSSQKSVVGLIVLRLIRRIVVLNFMVVPGEDPGKEPVSLAEILVGAVEGVALAIVL